MMDFDKIILIDDDPIFAFVTKEIIEASEMFNDNLLLYMNGARALQDFQETSLLDQKLLIFVDLKMPIVDGWDFLSEITAKGIHPETKIFVISSSENTDDRNRALSFAIVNDYISKPIDAITLAEIGDLVLD